MPSHHPPNICTPAPETLPLVSKGGVVPLSALGEMMQQTLLVQTPRTALVS